MTLKIAGKNLALGTYLRDNRQEYGKLSYWSLNAVSKRAGLSAPYLSQVEKGYNIKVDANILKSLSLTLQVDYGKLMYLGGYIDKDVSLHKTSREIPILGEIVKNDRWIKTYDTEIKESIAIKNSEFPPTRKLAAIRIKTQIKLFNKNYSSSNIVIIPLSHITLPLEDLIVLKKYV